MPAPERSLWTTATASAITALAEFLVPSPLFAQASCPLAWQPGDGIPGVDGPVHVLAPWDPDGAGPQTEVVVVGGRFTVAGDQMASNVALYDPALQRWSALGGGVGEAVNAIVVRGGAASGQLVVGTQAGVRAWSGTAWQALGPNFSGSVNHLVELANGDLVAGGQFGLVGGSPIVSLARWNGTQWQAMGNPTLPFSVGSILGMGVLPNGDLVVGGSFDLIGGVACSNIARWDGSAWHPLGAGSTIPVYRLVVNAVGDVLAVGQFGFGAGVTALWNGTNWSALPPGAPAGALPLAAHGSNGTLLRASSALWVLDPLGWTSLAAWSFALDVRCALQLANGDLLIGGSFSLFEGEPAFGLTHRRNGVFGSAGSGSFGTIQAVVPSAGGGYLVGGSFDLATHGPIRFAHFDGVTWTPRSVPASSVTSVVERDDGSVLLVGAFLSGGSQSPTHTLLRWQSGVATVVPLAAGEFATMAVAGPGATYVGTTRNGTVGVARWDGNFLVPTPIAVGGALVDMAVLPNGDIVLAGGFQSVSPSLLRWDGQQLQAIPGAPAGVAKLAVAANGDLLVGGQLSPPFSSIARWDGSTWHALGALPQNGALSIDVLPNGDIVLGQRLGAVPIVTRIQRWDGVQWTLLGEARGSARIVWSPAGELAAFGDFSRIDTTVSAMFTRLQSSCPATAQDLGGGCSGSAGPLTMRVATRAWIGAATRTVTSGIPANALAIGVFGASPVTLPLQLVLPIAGFGCTLRTAPDVLLPLPVANGEASVQWTLPSTPSLVGVSFAQQTVVLESAAGVATLVTTSNAAQLSVGYF